MTSQPLIDKVEVVDLRCWAGPGDDGLFVAVHGDGRTGCCGPIADETAQYVDALVGAAAVGRPVTDHHRLHEALRRAVDGHVGWAASWAVGAVDCAVWDLHGRLAGLPVAQLLAPAPADSVALYASWLRLDLHDPAAMSAVAKVGRGSWLFTKWGLRRGLAASSEPERLADVVHRVASTLEGPAAFDAVFTWNADLTCRFVEQVDPQAVLWLEDPLPACRPAEYAHLGKVAIGLAVGERLRVNADPELLLAAHPRALTIDVVGCGGLTRAVDLVTTAHERGILVLPHGRSLVPAVHLAAAFGQAIPAVEYQLQWEPVRQLLYAEPWLPLRGRISVPTTPGLGITPRSL